MWINEDRQSCWVEEGRGRKVEVPQTDGIAVRETALDTDGDGLVLGCVLVAEEGADETECLEVELQTAALSRACGRQQHRHRQRRRRKERDGREKEETNT